MHLHPAWAERQYELYQRNLRPQIPIGHQVGLPENEVGQDPIPKFDLPSHSSDPLPRFQ